MLLTVTTDTLDVVRANWAAKPLFVNSTGADCRPGKGVALYFLDSLGHRTVFPFNKQYEVGTTLFTTTKETQVAWLLNKPVTKEHPSDLSSSTRACLYWLKQFCLQSGTKHLAMPVIGGGLDKQPPRQIVDLLVETFSDTDLQIVISDPNQLIPPSSVAYKAESSANVNTIIMQRGEQLPAIFEENFSEVVPSNIPMLANFNEIPRVKKNKLQA
jgi:hypothetical protein